MLTTLSPDFFIWAGYFGVAFYIGSYVALQTGLMPGVGYSYATCNLFGASLVLVSLAHEWSRATAMISLAWIVISLVGITRTFLIKRRLYFSSEEEMLLKTGLPGMPREVARRFLDAGHWMTLDTGTFLTRQNEPVDHLFFIAQGLAGVFVLDTKVIDLEEGFIGELNVMEGGPASATVKTLQRTRVFRISGEQLRRMTKVDTQTGLYIETHLSTSTKQKLMQANLQLSATKGA